MASMKSYITLERTMSRSEAWAVTHTNKHKRSRTLLHFQSVEWGGGIFGKLYLFTY